MSNHLNLMIVGLAVYIKTTTAANELDPNIMHWIFCYPVANGFNISDHCQNDKNKQKKKQDELYL